MVRTVLDVRYGVRQDFEMGLEIPLLYTYDGILDEFIFDVERLLPGAKPRNIRRGQVSGRVTYRVSRHQRLFIAGQDDALGLGDVVLKAKVRLLREQERFPAVSLRAAVKFPSGDDSRRVWQWGELMAAWAFCSRKPSGAGRSISMAM